MSKVQTLRVFMKQRLTAAAEEIFELFERTIAEYEEELCRSQEENERQRKLLDAVTEPPVQLHKTGRFYIQQLLESKEEDPPEQQERSTSMDQEDPPELPHIKEEQRELWTRQEEEPLRELEEADFMFTLTSLPVKSGEDDEEEPQTSQLHQRQTEQMETEGDGEDCGGPEPERNSDPDSYLQPVADDEMSHCSEPEIDDDASEPETDDSSDWEPRKPQVPSEEQGSSCSVLKKPFPSRSDIVKHMRTHNREKRFRCSVCSKLFSLRGNLTRHLVVHTGEKPFSCSVCGTKFTQKSSLNLHLKRHAGGKPYTCSICQSSFSLRSYLITHMSSHSGEKRFRCSVCGETFSCRSELTRHLVVHTGEKPFSCSLCGTKFTHKSSLNAHLKLHARGKPYTCSICQSSFSLRKHLKSHMSIHDGEKPFSCSVCGKNFNTESNAQRVSVIVVQRKSY
uniref:C2H2-type domain-containing protein n=1 Tax=Sparus aurata TaxID=8175 RepID=A0A671WWR7_SPAAU